MRRLGLRGSSRRFGVLVLRVSIGYGVYLPCDRHFYVCFPGRCRGRDGTNGHSSVELRDINWEIDAAIGSQIVLSPVEGLIWESVAGSDHAI